VTSRGAIRLLRPSLATDIGADMAFFADCQDFLAPAGRCGVIGPSGVWPNESARREPALFGHPGLVNLERMRSSSADGNSTLNRMTVKSSPDLRVARCAVGFFGRIRKPSPVFGGVRETAHPQNS